MKYFTIFTILIFICCSNNSHKSRWDDDKSDWTPLMHAIYKHNEKKTKRLIQNGPDVTYTTSTSPPINALMVAVLSENDFAVLNLLETNKFTNLDLYFEKACLQKNVKSVQYFLNKNVNINSTQGSFTDLMGACVGGSPEIVELLLKNNSSINSQRDVDGITALMLAAFNGEPKKVEILLKYGAEKSIKDKNGHTAYDYINQIYPSKNISDSIKDELKQLLQ